ncbi:hypothetical protein [Brotaphodocola sp.]|uniref:hypothetical protein n=1 Tax=Brotaphodocola sp. TaxID=3073577 RepID=UPI003D7E09FA
MPEKDALLDNSEEFNLNHLKTDEVYINMAKLFLMSEDPKIHFADLQKPEKETQQRLDKIAGDIVSVAEGFLSDNPDVQKESEKKYEEYTNKCRATVMDMNVQKEAMYALGKNPDELASKEQKAVLKNPENAEKLGAFFGDLSECIQKADKTALLSEILVDNKSEKVPQIDQIAGETRVFSELYRDLAAEWTKSKAEKSNEDKNKEEKSGAEKSDEKPEKRAERVERDENEAKSDFGDDGLDFDEDASLLEDQLEEKVSKNLHVARAPKITGAQGLTTWQHIVNWLSEKLGFGKVYSNTPEEMKQAQETEHVQEERSQEKDAEASKKDRQPERSVEPERKEQLEQRADSVQSLKESRNEFRNQRQDQNLGESDAEKISSEKMIRQLQIENLRKDSMIKYLQAELLRAQIREQTLKNEKLMNEMSANQKTKKMGEAKPKVKAGQKTEAKPGRERISFAELSGEKPEPARRRMKLESIEPEKRRSKDDTMIDYRSIEPSEKTRKGLGLAPRK